MIDIIIPVLNEEIILTAEAEYYKTLRQFSKIIFVDGGSTDKTVDIAKEFGIVISSPAGRAIQKNYGFQNTAAEHVLFLHVDTFINKNALEQIEKSLDNGAVGGCLTMRIENKGLMFRLYEIIVNFRSTSFGIIDGDLGTFVRRDVFEQLGGFDLHPVMEDIIFSKKLHEAGPICVLQEPICVSSRKWHNNGFIKTFFEYTLAYTRLWTGRIKPSESYEEYCQTKYTAQYDGAHHFCP